MSTAFVIRPLHISQVHQRNSSARCPIASRRSEPESPRNRRVRIPRKYTSESANWEWNGCKSCGWRKFFNVEERVLRVIEALWSKSIRVSESPLLARMTALGARVLRRVTDAITRTLYPDTEKDLAVEYGLAEADPDDDNYVDPLREWETSNVTYYRDSFGRRVYLQLDGASGLVASTDYRDLHDEGDSSEEIVDDDQEESHPFGVMGRDDHFAFPDGFSEKREFDDRHEWT